ncbi:MAG: DUF805 domain-containing protein [Pseudomonadota bacterium]
MTDPQTTTLSPMRWLDTLFNPVGTSNKLDFTRAWTLLFFIQVSIVVVIPFVAGTVSLVGGTGAALSRFAIYASPIVFIVTTLSSYIIHTRRLRDASKPTWLAVLILIPLAAGMFSFVSSVYQKSSQYDALYQDRQLYLTDRPAYDAKQAEQAKKAQERASERAKAAAEAEARRAEELAKREPCPADPNEDAENAGSGGNRGGSWNSDEPSPEDPLPNQIEFVLTPNLGAVQGSVIPISALLAVWSLVYVARAPLPARYQHPSQGLARLYFSLRGRIGERQFWFGLLGWTLITGGGLLIAFLAGLIAGAMNEAIGGAVFGLVSLLVGLIATWMLHAILIKRLHDFGQPAWRVLIPFLSGVIIVILVSSIMLVSGVFPILHCGSPDWLRYVTIAFGLMFIVVCLLHFSWMAFSDPDTEANEYGEPPTLLEA